MDKFGRKEIEAINTAWNALYERLERWNWSATSTLQEATLMCRRARKGINETHIARALILHSVHEGYHNPSRRADALYGVDHGCILATILGAGARWRDDHARERTAVPPDAPHADDVWSPVLEAKIRAMIAARPCMSQPAPVRSSRFKAPE